MTAPPLHAGREAEGARPARGPAGPGLGSAVGPGGQVMPGPDWRRWRVPLALIGLIVIGGIVIALIARLITPRAVNPYLDPANTSVIGGHALADILGERGSQVIRAYRPSGALAALAGNGGQPTGAGPASTRARATLLITSPALLTRQQLDRLGRTRADLFLVAPGRATLAVLAPEVAVASRGRQDGQVLPPRCGLTAARLAGSANIGGFAYLAPARAVTCYPRAGYPSVIRLTTAGRTVTILGSGVAMTNDQLASIGNAALVLNLLGSPRRIVWLTPEPSGAQPVTRPGGPPFARSSGGPSLIPWPAWLVVIELGIAIVLAALWRARRLGPLITERLPVVVRASETVEGHARLYRSLRARATAAAALRAAMLSRVLPALGLNRDAPDDAVADALAARSVLQRPDVAGIVFGSPPATDAELVGLARSLDELERQVRDQ